MVNWHDKMKARYGSNCEQHLKYWNGTMTQERKDELAKQGYAYINLNLEKLLARGYRVVKSSAFTPKGVYDKYSPTSDRKDLSADTMFFEQQFDFQELKSLYDKYGRYENNFPIYFDTEEAFKAYAAKSDIFVVEDVSTNQPVGFATFQLIEKGTPAAKSMEADGIKVNDKLVYNDTIALSAEVQGKGLGRLLTNVLDCYYVQNFGAENDYALCTGEINTNDENALSKGFHELRGYGDWVEGSGKMKKWLDRWEKDEIEQRGPSIQPSFMRKSYIK